MAIPSGCRLICSSVGRQDKKNGIRIRNGLEPPLPGPNLATNASRPGFRLYNNNDNNNRRQKRAQHLVDHKDGQGVTEQVKIYRSKCVIPPFARHTSRSINQIIYNVVERGLKEWNNRQVGLRIVWKPTILRNIMERIVETFSQISSKVDQRKLQLTKAKNGTTAPPQASAVPPDASFPLDGRYAESLAGEIVSVIRRRAEIKKCEETITLVNQQDSIDVQC